MINCLCVFKPLLNHWHWCEYQNIFQFSIIPLHLNLKQVQVPIPASLPWSKAEIWEAIWLGCLSCVLILKCVSKGTLGNIGVVCVCVHIWSHIYCSGFYLEALDFPFYLNTPYCHNLLINLLMAFIIPMVSLPPFYMFLGCGKWREDLIKGTLWIKVP